MFLKWLNNDTAGKKSDDLQFKDELYISTQSFFFFLFLYFLFIIRYLLFVAWASVVVNYDPYITVTLEMLVYFGVFGYPGISLYDSV